MSVLSAGTALSDISPKSTSLSSLLAGLMPFPEGVVLRKYTPFPMSFSCSPIESNSYGEWRVSREGIKIKFKSGLFPEFQINYVAWAGWAGTYHRRLGTPLDFLALPLPPPAQWSWWAFGSRWTGELARCRSSSSRWWVWISRDQMAPKVIWSSSVVCSNLICRQLQDVIRGA